MLSALHCSDTSARSMALLGVGDDVEVVDEHDDHDGLGDHAVEGGAARSHSASNFSFISCDNFFGSNAPSSTPFSTVSRSAMFYV
jgi:hypothetical protein